MNIPSAADGALDVLLGDYPHTRVLRDGTIPVEDVECRFLTASPLHSAFPRMVRGLEFDVCEMPVATYLLARDAGVPVTLLPAVLIGATHHHSLTRLPDGPDLDPRRLAGHRIGVRSYGQTTGMWVRGILREDYGVDASDVTWVTTEDAHVASYVNPPNVERSPTGAVAALLQAGDVDAAVLGPRAIGVQGIPLVPVIKDAEEAAAAWTERHGTVPANHLLVVRDDVLRSRPDAVTALFRALARGIDETAAERDLTTAAGRAVTAGWSDTLARGLEVAARYALEQGLVSAPVDLARIQKDMAFLEG
ncbi:ABC transporter substrate-binding protein [Streptomyces nodosus]|uniref:ABC transporter substrate-binding protein n=1 Tax=Streptomyces nodosus TaxID=40318 RepID=A0A5P2VX70_9ACTN|nr:ABC transporter substrate-binding protein [Streptomyces nodosus]MBB4789582.1 4,5-dihydroxyphthalate decarboxylase [Streptomyces nodosus]QEV37392.1 ABC transporter substrate-binding protein [Streptomyces nodosus]